ncbi:hypothetical protein [Limosilactobacillus caecicola]|uniref:hypothetical protein n=1 Tax=Limosilactobacillus caecicola TaxID=2941332 RepID=UPI00203E64F6|nr:hypothetical protein [Limosilactobacillus caecicola]
MPSRMEYRQQVQPVETPKHHWGTTIIGALAVVLLVICALAKATVLNEKFVEQQVTSSAVSAEVKNDLNASLASYGLSGGVITTKQTRQLLKQATRQVYQGKRLHLDMSSVSNSLENKAVGVLSSYGVSSSVLSSLPTGSVNDQVSTIINNRINSEAITNLENGLRLGRLLNLTGLIISIIILMLIVMRSWFTKTLVRDFRWITLLGGLGSALLLVSARPVIHSLQVDYASFSTVINQVSNAILKVGWQMVIVDLVLAIVLWMVSLFLRGHRS